MPETPEPVPTPRTAAEPAAIIAKLQRDEAEWQRRAAEVQAQAAHAFARLLVIAETSETGQAGRVARFVASTFNGLAYPFDPFSLRALDVAISDDMLLCLDAVRWAKADLHKLVPDGESRVKAILRLWQIEPACGG